MFKTNNIPPIFVVSLEECSGRRANLYRQFQRHNITNFYFCIFKRYHEYNWNIRGRYLDKISLNSYGPVTSHVAINKFWTSRTPHDYVLILEDDVDLSTIDLWNFRWDEFYRSIPEDWELTQLSIMREFPEDLEFRLKQRFNHDFGCQAYLIKRRYAEEIARRYWRPDGFELTMPPCTIYHDPERTEYVELFPIVENIMYESVGTTYSIPMFCEDLTNTITTNPEGSVEDYRIPCRDLLIEKIPTYKF